MATDEQKERRKFWSTVLLAAIGAVTAVGNGVRSYYERQNDVEKATLADVRRVEADRDIQTKVQEGLAELDSRHDEDVDALQAQLEDLAEENIELRIHVEAVDLLMTQRGISDSRREEALVAAIRAQAKRAEVDADIDVEGPDEGAPTEELIDAVAAQAAKKKRPRRKERPAPKLLFEAPEPVYQMQQQMQLPMLPPKK